MPLTRPTAVIGSAMMVPAKAAEVLKVGTRVTTKYAEKRIGDVLDFWFEPDAK